MSDLDALLAGIVAHPHEHLRWLVMADWLDDHGFPERAELVRVHRELLRTCTDPDAHPERPQLHARMMELMRAGVLPCIPEKTLTLPGGVELKMSFIPPGSFLMGSPETEDERGNDETLHRVTVTTGFWLGQTPVTQAQWRAVMGTKPSVFQGDRLPVDEVSWGDTVEFVTALKVQAGIKSRLPTEAEWEYAARSGTTTPFYWGDQLNGTQANCNGNFPYGTATVGPFLGTTTEVGSYTGVSPHPWGLADVIGNLCERCGDWYDSYPADEGIDPVGPESGSIPVQRGGGHNQPAWVCRAAFRFGRRTPALTNFGIGFRIATDLE